MSRSKDSKRLTIGSRAVAVAIMAEALDMAYANAQAAGDLDAYNQTQRVAEQLVSMAWDVEYKPTAERLVITIDAGVSGPDRMRSTPEDHQTALDHELDGP